jgi:hypothetical protein
MTTESNDGKAAGTGPSKKTDSEALNRMAAEGARRGRVRQRKNEAGSHVIVGVSGIGGAKADTTKHDKASRPQTKFP